MPIKQVLETRPDMCLVAEYPSAEGRLDSFQFVYFWVLVPLIYCRWRDFLISFYNGHQLCFLIVSQLYGDI